MVSILILGDIHYSLNEIDDIFDLISNTFVDDYPDFIITTGDFLPRTRYSKDKSILLMEDIERSFRKFRVPVYAVLGNHDYKDLYKNEGCIQLVDVYLGYNGVYIDDFSIIGIGGSWPLDKLPYEWVDDISFEKLIESKLPIKQNNEILLTHVPPKSKRLGITYSGERVGSNTIRNIILKRNPFLNICGHIHESEGWEIIGSTLSLNAGSLTNFKTDNTIDDITSLNKNNKLQNNTSFHLLKIDFKSGLIEDINCSKNNHEVWKIYKHTIKREN